MDADKMRSVIEAEQAKYITQYEVELEKMKALVDGEQRKLDALKTLARDCIKENELLIDKREEFRNRLQAIMKGDSECFG